MDEKSDQHGGEIIGQVLKAHGVEHIFTLSARNNNSPIIRGAEKNGIKVIQTKHEVTAVAAADANSRVTGLPGVALVSCAPGLTNTIAAIKASAKAESALVLIGQSSSPILREEHLEITNQMKTLKPLVKWTGRVTRIRDIAYELREALRQALHGTPGPVYIQFNLDVLYPFPHVKKELERRGSNWYLDYYIQNLFAAGFDVGREIRPWPIEIPFPKKDQVSRVVKALTKSEKPLIIMGSQASLPPIEDSKISTILQDLGVPCFFEGTARGILPRTHPLYLKHGLKEAVAGSDLILLLGVPSDFKTGVKTRVAVYAVNRNKNVLKHNATNFNDSSVLIQSDVGQFLIEVNEKIGRFAISEEWLTTVKKRSVENEKILKDSNPVSSVMDDVLPESTIIISDGSDFANTSAGVLQSKGPWIESSVSAKLGSTAGYSMGVKLAKPESTVCTLIETSSLSYTISELGTCVSTGIPVVHVVGSNLSKPVSVVDPSTGHTFTDLVTAATESGARGFMSICSKKNPAGDLKVNLDRAIQSVKEGSPVLLHVQLE